MPRPARDRRRAARRGRHTCSRAPRRSARTQDAAVDRSSVDRQRRALRGRHQLRLRHRPGPGASTTSIRTAPPPSATRSAATASARYGGATDASTASASGVSASSGLVLVDDERAVGKRDEVDDVARRPGASAIVTMSQRRARAGRARGSAGDAPRQLGRATRARRGSAPPRAGPPGRGGIELELEPAASASCSWSGLSPPEEPH